MGFPLRRRDPRVPFRGRKESFTLNGASSNPRAHSNQPFSHFFSRFRLFVFFFLPPPQGGARGMQSDLQPFFHHPSISSSFSFSFFLFFLTQHPQTSLSSLQILFFLFVVQIMQDSRTETRGGRGEGD